MIALRVTRIAAAVVVPAAGAVAALWAVEFGDPATVRFGWLQIVSGAIYLALLVLVATLAITARRPAAHRADVPKQVKGWLGRLTPGMRYAVVTLIAVAIVGMVCMSIIGLIGSYFTIKELARPYLGKWAWTAPVAADIGAVILIVLNFVASILQLRGAIWLRLVTVAWLAGTVSLNLIAGGDVTGTIIHALFPGSVIVFTELLRWFFGKLGQLEKLAIEAELKIPKSPYEPFPVTDWIFMPGSTPFRWRRRRMWRIPSLEEFADADARYVLAKGQIKRRFGKQVRGVRIPFSWRFTAPDTVKWALERNQFDDKDIAQVRAALSREVFGGIISEIGEMTPQHASTGGGQDQHRPAPPADEAPANPPKGKRRASGNGRAGAGGQADLQTRREQAYGTYVAYVQEHTAEPSGRDLMADLGITNDANARRVRNEVLRPRFVAEHGYDPSQPSSNGHGPSLTAVN